MKLILKPLFRTRLGSLVFGEGDALIGRFEEPFDTCHEPFVARLSRRHAFLVVQADAVYLIDLGSLNGTKVNGRPLRAHVARLQAGDQISLAEQATFQVALADRANFVPPPFQLTLTPLSDQSGLEPIEPPALPWLISRADGRWLGFGEQPPATLSSQKIQPQALLSFRDGQVHVTDVSHPSTTQVDDYLLEGETVPLRNQARLILDRHVYSARFKRPTSGSTETDLQATTAVETYEDSEPSVAETQLIEAVDIKKTTYVETPKSFLDLLSQPEKPEETVSERGAAQAPLDNPLSTHSKSGRKTRAWAKRIQTIMPRSRELEIRHLWWGGALVIALIGCVGFFYGWNAAERQIRQLLAQGHHAESVRVANRYLQFHDDDGTISVLGSEALIRYIVPYWVKSLEKNAFAEASATLDQAGELTQFNEPGRKVLRLLKWMTDLDQFFTERGELSLVIFRDEDRLQDLLTRWDEDAGEHERRLATISRYEPTFESARSRALSHLRALRGEAPVYLKAIEELKGTIARKLQTDRIAELGPVFTDFAAKYPKVGGMDALNRDLGQYLELKEVIQTKTLALASRFADGTLFSTPPFRDKAAELASQELPSAEILAEYEEASKHWRAGEMAQAMAVLDLAKTQKWGEVAARRLERYQRIATDFKRIQLSPKNGECGPPLFDFRGRLSREEDAFFLKATEADFQRCRPQILNVAEESFKLAKDAWEAYRNAGGINGRLRLETSLSETFRQQAKRLADACVLAARGERIYDQLSLAYPPSWRESREQLFREIKQQRQSLDDLSVVLEPGLLKSKLDMLPLPQQDNS